jgi:hypothetical protein
MKTNHVAGSFLMLAAAVLVGCTSNDGGTVSPTVKPAPPSLFGGGQQPAAPAPGAPLPTAPAPAPSGVQTTYSGLKYEVLRPGTGARPASYNRVKVHYHGYLPDGTVFDSSVQRGEPATFGLNQVIPGWREGIPLMQVGAKYRFTVPPHLAYGARGAPPKIGPNQTLMFDVELFEVLY